MPAHNTITDPNLHEPKGIAAATVGQVYVSDGVGSGSWQNAPTIPHACIRTLEGDSQTVATIGTIPITLPFTTDGPATVLTANQANNRIVVNEAGDYLVNFQISFNTTAAGDAGLYKFRVLDDGTATPLLAAKQMSGSADTDTVSVSGILAMGASSVITITVESDEAGGTDDIDVTSSSLAVTQVKKA